jgi:hypothetical protein
VLYLFWLGFGSSPLLLAATRYLQAKKKTRMNKNLEQIFELESTEKYNEAYSLYQKLISENNLDFQTWKYYFFFLWTMIEDVNGLFTKDIDLRTELESELKNGINKYSDLAEFNFIAGYTICIFPYEFGDYKELETKGFKMLKKASEMEPSNPIYKMAYLGSKVLNEKEQSLYEKACEETKPILETEYCGKGFLNEYFSQVFNRYGKNASR